MIFSGCDFFQIYYFIKIYFWYSCTKCFVFIYSFVLFHRLKTLVFSIKTSHRESNGTIEKQLFINLNFKYRIYSLWNRNLTLLKKWFIKII